MNSPNHLRRIIRREVPEVDAIEILLRDPFEVDVFISPKPGSTFEQLKPRVLDVVNEAGFVAVFFYVRPFADAPVLRSAPPPRLSDRMYLASLAADQSTSGFKEALVRAVPELRALRIVNDKQTKVTTLQVASADGAASPALVSSVREAAYACAFAGHQFDVVPLPPGETQNQLENAEFLMPRRETDIVRYTEEDEDCFATRIRRLVDHDVRDPVGLVDDFAGTKIYSTPTFGRCVPLHCLLAYYDRVYVEMLPVVAPDAEKYFLDNYGVDRANFVAFARSGRVVPVFKFNLGNYAHSVVGPWMERLDLPFVSPRELDYIAARHAWQLNPQLKLARATPEIGQALARLVRASTSGKTEAPHLAAARRVFEWQLHAVDAFEGLAFHRGHISLANLGPGAPLAYYMLAHEGVLSASKEAAVAISLDIFSAVKDIALAQAFGASLNEGTVLNDVVLTWIAELFGEGRRLDDTGRVRVLAQLIPSLDIGYEPSVPAVEYLELFDQHETKRIRAIVAELLVGLDDEGRSQQELRQRVQALNGDVARLRKRAIEVAAVDVVGEVAKTGAAAGGNKLLSTMLAALQTSLAKGVVARAVDALVEDSAAGHAIDVVRGAINGVPAAAVRLYRVRRRLGRS
jgi:hypothetical protein